MRRPPRFMGSGHGAHCKTQLPLLPFTCKSLQGAEDSIWGIVTMLFLLSQTLVTRADHAQHLPVVVGRGKRQCNMPPPAPAMANQADGDLDYRSNAQRNCILETAFLAIAINKENYIAYNQRKAKYHGANY